LDQVKVYGAVPPDTVKSMEPLEPPGQVGATAEPLTPRSSALALAGSACAAAAPKQRDKSQVANTRVRPG
jgi:hypothetical protein